MGPVSSAAVPQGRARRMRKDFAMAKNFFSK
jgi:hypothetical protein